MKKRRGIAGHLALKLDLDKVYDRLEWDFIRDTLEFFIVPVNLRILIMDMINNTTFKIHWMELNCQNLHLVASRGIFFFFQFYAWKD